MNPPAIPNQTAQDLHKALEKRLAIIADHQWRDSDPENHLEALKAISMEIDTICQQWRNQQPIPRQLDHFLRQASYTKALDWLKAHL